MKAILKNLYNLETMNLLEGYRPAEIESFGIWIRMIIGEEHLGGEESFDIMLCTPKWLIENHDKSEILIGRHHLIVFEFNYQRIFKRLKELVEGCHGDSWNEIGSKIARIGHWEFEDYKPR